MSSSLAADRGSRAEPEEESHRARWRVFLDDMLPCVFLDGHLSIEDEQMLSAVAPLYGFGPPGDDDPHAAEVIRNWRKKSLLDWGELHRRVFDRIRHRIHHVNPADAYLILDWLAQVKGAPAREANELRVTLREELRSTVGRTTRWPLPANDYRSVGPLIRKHHPEQSR